MTQPDKTSHWASLAQVLGAKVPPEKPAPAAPKTESPEAAAPAPAPAPPAAKPAKPKPAAKPKDNWGSVLGMLGLRAPEPEPTPEPEAPVAEAPAPSPIAAKADDEWPPVAREPAPASEWEKPFLASQPLPKNLWELVGDASPPPPSATVEESLIEETYTEVGGNDLTLGEDVDDGWDAPRPSRSREDDRPRHDREEGSGGRRRRRRRRRSEPGVEAAENAPVAHDEDLDEPRYEARPFEEEEEIVADRGEDDFEPSRPSEDAEGEGRPRRRRRRRGRGRGRSGDREAAAPASEPVARDAYDDEDVEHEPDDDLELPRGGRSAPPARSSAPRGSASPARGARMRSREDEEMDEDEDDDHHEIDVAEHRGIPTWNEAMAIVVGANMEARAKNPHGGSRGGRGRGGRGRGGRGR